ncbi:MAG: hypothetical protein IJF41_07390, partial [Clostridia bacterium]|nr:hypothetical protein [Clostridia bacterium]
MEEETILQFYLSEKEAVLAELNSRHEGLSAAEARTRLEQNGPNALKAAPKQSLLSRFLDQMKDPM